MHTENCRWRLEAELKGTAKADAAMRRMKEYPDRAIEERNETNDEEGHKHEPDESTVRTEENAPALSSSGSGNAAQAHSGSSGRPTRMTGQERGDRGKEATKEECRWRNTRKIQNAMMGSG